MTNRKEYMKKYQQEHKEAFRIASQKYRDKNRKQYNEHSNEYRKRKEAKENAELVIKYKEVLDKIREEIKKYKYTDSWGDTVVLAKYIEDILEEIK